MYNIFEHLSSRAVVVVLMLYLCSMYLVYLMMVGFHLGILLEVVGCNLAVVDSFEMGFDSIGLEESLMTLS